MGRSCLKWQVEMSQGGGGIMLNSVLGIQEDPFTRCNISNAWLIGIGGMNQKYSETHLLIRWVHIYLSLLKSIYACVWREHKLKVVYSAWSTFRKKEHLCRQLARIVSRSSGQRTQCPQGPKRPRGMPSVVRRSPHRSYHPDFYLRRTSGSHPGPLC